MTIDYLRKITKDGGWLEVAEYETFQGQRVQINTDEFSTYWIEAGHRIREQLSNDNLLCQLLRQNLPTYQDGPQVLYRGENVDRWDSGNIGVCWTESIKVAKMFAQGLNAVKSGGILIRASFSPEAIISGPNDHSIYLQESQFTVDPSLATGLEVIERYPAL